MACQKCELARIYRLFEEKLRKKAEEAKKQAATEVVDEPAVSENDSVDVDKVEQETEEAEAQEKSVRQQRKHK